MTNETRDALRPFARWARAWLTRLEGAAEAPIADTLRIALCEDVPLTIGDLRAMVREVDPAKPEAPVHNPGSADLMDP